MAVKKIRIRRGLQADLPTLDIGEFGFTTDTNKLYIGSAAGNLLVNPAEQDSIFEASVASDILQGDINNWNQAFEWGDHSEAGYATESFVTDAISAIPESDLSGLYEVGTWNPTFGSLFGSFGPITYDILDASYVRIGRQVTVSCTMRTTALDRGTAGSVVFVTLPFEAAYDQYIFNIRCRGFVNNPYIGQPFDSRLFLGYQPPGTTGFSDISFITPGDLSAGELLMNNDNQNLIQFQITYITASTQ